MKKKTSFLLVCGMTLLILVACSEEKTPMDTDRDAYLAQVDEWRAMKNEKFRTSEKSPLPEKDKENFSGLPYFPVNPALRLKVTLKKLETPEPMDMLTSDGSPRKVLRYGYFTFILDDKVQRLYAYKFINSSNDSLLFIPFRDSTSGEESYAGGRYLDVQEQADSNVYTLDFNMAYNPSCAYGRPEYVCPVPPAENTLEVAIRAGEKKWH